MGLGSVKRLCALVLSLFCYFPGFSQNARTFRYHQENEKTEYSFAEDGSIYINYRLPEVSVRRLTNEHGMFYRLAIPGHISTSSPGKPELPVLSHVIQIPDGASCNIKISEVRTARLKPYSHDIKGILYPSQESESKDPQRQRPAFRIERDSYDRKSLIASDTVTIEKLGVLRKTALANLYIKPARYNPHTNTVEIITSMKIEVHFIGAKGITGSNSSASFSSSLSSGILNYNPDLIPDFTDQPAGMIILTDTAFRKQIQPFVKWKTQKGFRVRVLYKGASLAGDTYGTIKSTISGIYNSTLTGNPYPDYLLIIGDINRIPSYGASTNTTDMYYAEFDGNGDYIPEMYVGRIPATDTSEVSSTLKKIIQYEKFEFADTNTFYSRALATTGYDPDHSNYMNGQIKYTVSNYLTSSNYVNESHFYHFSGSEPEKYLSQQKDSIIKLINKGTSFINYSGHGDATGWQHISIKTSDTASLSNKSMYPFIISNACRTAQFGTSSSFGNRMVLEKDRGASGFIGCSNDSYWDEDYYWCVGLGNISEDPAYTGKGLGALDRLFHTHNENPSEWYCTLGQINYSGNLSVSASTSFWKRYYWETYNVIGDPSMMPIIGTPKRQNVTLPDTLPNGIKSISLNIEPFSYIAISHSDTLWDASFAGRSGSVTLDIPGISNSSCLIVITAQNRFPVIKKVYFSDISKEFLNLDQTSINDISGNNNKKADFRENIFLSLKLANLGLTEATGTYARISTSSPMISILQDSAYIGTIPARSQVTVSDKFEIKIRDDVPDLGIVSIPLLVKSNKSSRSYTIDMVVHSPKLSIRSFVIDDTKTGNGDHIADPGETFDIVLRLNNDGSSDASGSLSISSTGTNLSILQPTINIPVLKQYSLADMPVRVRLGDDVASGDYFDIVSNLVCPPFSIDQEFTLRAGKVRESFESMSFNIFPWINRSSVPWIITESNPYEGRISARSGNIPDNGSTSLIIKTIYAAPDSVRFHYRVSCEENQGNTYYDYLSFSLNGKEVFKRSGETGWMRAAIPVPEGMNTMEWRYTKDRSKSVGADCAWIDMIDFVTTGSVSYIQKDLNVARILPLQINKIGKADIKVKVLNAGRDTINGFNLAYTLGNGIPVRQIFNKVLLPGGDSTEVTFPYKADLSKFGTYRLSVYGFNNSDDYFFNDTLSIDIVNTDIRESLIVYPNPFNDHFTVYINTPEPDRINMSLVSTNGSVLFETTRDLVIGGNPVNIDMKGFAPSTYYLYIRGMRINKTIPIVKVNN